MSSIREVCNGCPTDHISSVTWKNEESNDCSSSLLVSSWDGALYVYKYDGLETKLEKKMPLGIGALLDCKWYRGNAFTGGLGGQLVNVDFCKETIDVMGTHDDAIKSIVVNEDHGTIFSGSWDRTISSWDPRIDGSASIRKGRIHLPGKVYSMDTKGNILLCAMSDRLINIYDIRKLDFSSTEIVPLERRESSLKYMTRCVKLFPDTSSFVCSSIEGRVSVDYLNGSMDPFAFKCHRSLLEDGQTELVHPVNAVAINSKTQTFCTGGADGVVAVWDPQAKKRIRAYPKLLNSISSLDINQRGDLLAIASSYGWEEGEKDHAPDSIYIRRLDSSDMRGGKKA